MKLFGEKTANKVVVGKKLYIEIEFCLIELKTYPKSTWS